MIVTYLQTITPAPGQVAVVFAVGDPPTPYTTAPLDLAALQGLTPAQRRAVLIAAARAVLPPPPPAIPSLGLNPGDVLDLG